jgi:hypothetical protein
MDITSAADLARALGQVGLALWGFATSYNVFLTCDSLLCCLCATLWLPRGGPLSDQQSAGLNKLLCCRPEKKTAVAMQVFM